MAGFPELVTLAAVHLVIHGGTSLSINVMLVPLAPMRSWVAVVGIGSRSEAEVAVPIVFVCRQWICMRALWGKGLQIGWHRPFQSSSAEAAASAA